MAAEREDHAGKPPQDQHPVGEGTTADGSDHADPRVVQPGDDPPGEDALHRDSDARG
jgi:hypothetical protein